MAKIRSTTDPAERQKLMLEHMSAMREGMGSMVKMGDSAMGMMPGGGMMKDGGKSSAKPEAGGMGGRMGMMEQRMGMMQMMLDQDDAASGDDGRLEVAFE